MDRQVLMVRQAKGGKDRVVVLPRTLQDTLHHSVATHLLQAGTDIRTVQELLGRLAVAHSPASKTHHPKDLHACGPPPQRFALAAHPLVA